MNNTALEEMRRQMYSDCISNGFNSVLDGRHNPSFVAEKARQLVDTSISMYESDALIPIHCPHPLKSRVLNTIAKNGIVTRTVPVNTEVFWGASENERAQIINRAMVENGHGSLTDITYKQVGFSEGGKKAYIEATARYNAPSNSNIEEQQQIEEKV